MSKKARSASLRGNVGARFQTSISERGRKVSSASFLPPPGEVNGRRVDSSCLLLDVVLA